MTTNELPVLQAGCLAYLDTFNGLVPCRVLSIDGDSQGHVCAPSPRVTVKITGERGAYHRGMIEESTGFHVIPRACRVRRGCYWRINTAYVIKAS